MAFKGSISHIMTLAQSPICRIAVPLRTIRSRQLQTFARSIKIVVLFIAFHTD
jgi:hypothetical protein